MSSLTGGQFVFSTGSAQAVTLGINNGIAPVFPTATAGNLNIEVFTAAGLTTLPALDAGFNQGILDPNGGLSSTGFLRGSNLTLFGGNYLLADNSTTGGSSVT